MRDQLSKLLGITEQEEFRAEIRMLDVRLISPNPWQPRYVFNEEELAELSQSIREHGIIQPLLVRQRGSTYHLIAGERRLRAAKLANLTEVPVIVRDIDDRETAILAMVENLQRKDLDFVEEARGYKRLLEEYDLTQEGLAKMVGKSQSSIANKMRLLQLPPEVLERIRTANLSERHARALLAIKEQGNLRKVLSDIIAGKLNVIETEDLIKEIHAQPTIVKPTGKTGKGSAVGNDKKATLGRPPNLQKAFDGFEAEVARLAEAMEVSGFKVELALSREENALNITLKCKSIS
jgi:ParB/RepB/Spo0J family partition protein